MPAIVGVTGPLAGQRFELDGDVVLGRENAAIALADEETSRRHAELTLADGVLTIMDLRSTNGTFVNGERIDRPVELHGGETIRLGQSTFTVEVEAVADRGATRVSERPEVVADPDITVLRERPPERAAPADEPEPAEAPHPAAPTEGPELTAPRPRPAPAPPEPPRAPPAPPAWPPLAPPPARPLADQPFGAFAAPAPPSRRGVASRKLGPAIVSFAAVLTTAVALVVYFAGR